MDALESRIIELESIVAQQDRTMDDLSQEILHLHTLIHALNTRLDEQERRAEEASLIKPLSEETPPPHY